MFSISRNILAGAVLILTMVPLSHAQNVPFVKKHLYSETANPTADIAAALKQARAEHKRVILDFGGDWCGDCQVLDIYMHQSPNAELLAKHFIVVHVDIGQMDHNVAVAEKYKVPIKKGVPALAVLDAHGNLLYSQANKEFENMRNMRSEDVTAFLNKWKAHPAPTPKA
ncbi:thioredoxin-like protein [Edaphobacter aggregans]|uniref:Thioredoxin-like protein n=1 Tax=Edaphobacter aggregans TaxID=570835 RepID=A0A3R9P0I5_9BACT|nr:thioredoxin family protein [Edaphobacter aggregans]RSL18200.1 thioredoxin-like protein [Edaphobacter aggregans]